MDLMALAARAVPFANNDERGGTEITRGGRELLVLASPTAWSASCYSRIPVMRLRSWVVWGCMLASTAMLTPDAARASYAVRARWQPSADAGVIGYRVYTRPAGGTFTRALDAGTPPPASDGTLAGVVRGLDPCTAYGVVVAAYRTDGTESAFSNEITLTYARVAPLIDPDGDGLSTAAEDKDLDCVVDAGETDPNRADTDGDGIADPRDACQGTLAGAPVNGAGCSCAQITCDDGNACNGRETCLAGVCQPGTPPDCNDGNACTLDACSRTAGCTHTAVAACTPCSTAAQCDDHSPCTADSCAAGRCLHAPLADGTACGDGLFCNGAETCRGGLCTAGAPVACADADPCTRDACDETQRRCTHASVAGCTPCSTAAQCDDGVACTADGCVAGRCVHAAAPDGTACGDRVFCNGSETCRGGICVSGEPVGCDDANACTFDACDEAERRCTHAPVAACCTADAECAVADACHTNARCEAGQCLSDPVACADPGPCAEASCDPQAGCRTTPLPDGTPCDDGDACTLNDACTAGACGAAALGAPAADAGTEPIRTRLRMRRTSGGLLVNARASFPAADLDTARGDLGIALRDAGGSTLFETTVPGSRFTAIGESRAVYRDDQRAEGGGLTTVELRVRRGRGYLTLSASVPPTSADRAALEAIETEVSASATLDWHMRSASGCVNGSGQCKGRARRCR
jgi:hypothetical protein